MNAFTVGAQWAMAKIAAEDEDKGEKKDKGEEKDEDKKKKLLKALLAKKEEKKD